MTPWPYKIEHLPLLTNDAQHLPTYPLAETEPQAILHLAKLNLSLFSKLNKDDLLLMLSLGVSVKPLFLTQLFLPVYLTQHWTEVHFVLGQVEQFSD